MQKEVGFGRHDEQGSEVRNQRARMNNKGKSDRPRHDPLAQASAHHNFRPLLPNPTHLFLHLLQLLLQRHLLCQGTVEALVTRAELLEQPLCLCTLLIVGGVAADALCARTFVGGKK